MRKLSVCKESDFNSIKVNLALAVCCFRKADYPGCSVYLTNVLSMLSLVEGGIGTSIVYNLYKPLAENDEEKIIALVQLYKKIYGVLAVIIFILSLTLYPFLGTFMKENPNVKFMSIIYKIC